MVQVYKDFKSMLAHLRGKEVEIKHNAVKVEDILKKKDEKKKKKTKKKEK